jgi:hypothetical protein
MTKHQKKYQWQPIMDEIKKFSLGSTEPSKKTSPEFEKEYMSFQIKWLEDCIKELKQNQQWQPIDTAPYDTMIFVLYHRGQIGTIVLDSGYYKPKTITHWLPIPTLPKNETNK